MRRASAVLPVAIFLLNLSTESFAPPRERVWRGRDREALVYLNHYNERTSREQRHTQFLEKAGLNMSATERAAAMRLVEPLRRLDALERELSANPSLFNAEKQRQLLELQQEMARRQRELIENHSVERENHLDRLARSLSEAGTAVTVTELLPRGYRTRVGDTEGSRDGLPPAAQEQVTRFRSLFGWEPGRPGKPKALERIEKALEEIFKFEDPSTDRLNNVYNFVRDMLAQGGRQGQTNKGNHAADLLAGRPSATENLAEGLSADQRSAVNSALGATISHGTPQALGAFVEYFRRPERLLGQGETATPEALRNVRLTAGRALMEMERIYEQALRENDGDHIKAAEAVVRKLIQTRRMTLEQLRRFKDANCPGSAFLMIPR